MSEDQFLKQVVPVIFWLTIISAVCNLYFVHRTSVYIRQNHPDLWERLGRFGLFENNTPITGFKFFMYLVKGEWKQSEDPVLVSKARKTLFWLCASLIVLTLCEYLSAAGH